MKHQSKKIVYNACIILLILTGAGFIVARFAHFGRIEYTDNAQVRQHITPQNTRVQGFIKEIRFEEYQPVSCGDTLVVIEDAEFRLRLAQAEADLANAYAGKDVSGATITTTGNNILVTQSAIEELRVELDNAEREAQRYARLLEEEAVTQQQYDRVRTTYKALRARYAQMQRQEQSVRLTREEQTKRLEQNDANIRLAEAAVELARLNLSYCVIVATCDGVAGKKNINVGQLVQPGQTMVDIVDSGEMWVIANYRESQLPNIRLGASVEIRADAVPGKVYCGTVEAISDATGAAVSLIPTDNATGNFVKVEQRIPIRIALSDNDSASLALLRAGFNVECEVAY